MTSVEISSASLRTTCPMLLRSFPRMRDVPFERRSGSDGRRAQEHLRIGISHAAFEITVGGRESSLAVSKRTLMDSQAGAAARIHDDGSGRHQRAKISFCQGLRVDSA